jgi:hypothetical protein
MLWSKAIPESWIVLMMEGDGYQNLIDEKISVLANKQKFNITKNKLLLNTRVKNFLLSNL